MTVVLNPETEALVREEAERSGRDIDAVVDALIRDALARAAEDFEETVAGIERGWAAAESGRERLLSEYISGVRDTRAHLATGTHAGGN